VLLIDPDADNRTMNAVSLEKQAFLVLEAETGEDALKLATTTMPSVVVMDWRLAGPVTGEGLRYHFRTRGVPVIGLTSLDLDDAYLWTRREGCVVLLPKPVAPNTLAAIVKGVSGAHQAIVSCLSGAPASGTA
jgi:DNA-binding response OmpR family regulator